MEKNTIYDTLEKYYKLIIKKKAGIDVLDFLCKKRYGIHFKNIVLMNCDELTYFVNDVIGADTEEHAKEFNNISTFGNYVVNNLYGNMSQLARKIIYEFAGTKVCPYCNRNYISFIVDRGCNPTRFFSTFELDHLYSKKDYPMLAVSFYNLIPVCPACNRIKGIKRINLAKNGKYGYRNDYDFSYDILGSGFLVDEELIKIIIEQNIDRSPQQILHLEELYNNHKDILQEIVMKARCYGKWYFQGLIEKYGQLMGSEIDAYRFYFGSYLLDNDWGKRPLSKFIYDIAKETLGFYGVDVNRL